MTEHAILIGQEVVPVDDVLTWARAFEDHDRRRVAQTPVDGVNVSTVFLGLNHSFGAGPDLWFETMVFGGPLDQETVRYTTWEQAEKGHREMVERVRAANVHSL